MDETNPPPCHGRDEWTREPGHNNDTSAGNPDRQLVDRADTVFAQVVCMTRCPHRTTCMEAALDYESRPEEVGSHYVWGGYRGYERARVLDGRPLVPPASRDYYGEDTRDAYLAMFAQANGDIFGFCRRNNIAPKTALDRAAGYVWQLRVAEGDPWVTLHDGQVVDMSNDANSPHAPDTARVA